MKNVYEVLRQKELELTRLEKEVEALRVAAPLLSDEKEQLAEAPKPSLAPSAQPQPVRVPPVGKKRQNAGRRPGCDKDRACPVFLSLRS